MIRKRRENEIQNFAFKMAFLKIGLLMLISLFFLTSCKLNIFTFKVSDIAQTHQIINATITGEALYTGESAGSHGIVLQIPNEFHVLSAKSVDNKGGAYVLMRNLNYESFYSPEQGYKVWAGFSNSSTDQEDRTHTVTIELFTGTKSGTYKLKASAAVFRNSTLEADDPADEFNFANITDDKYVETIKLNNKWDMREDGKIGLEEAINALQVTAGLRKFQIIGLPWKADNAEHSAITVTNNSDQSVVALFVVKKSDEIVIDPNDSSVYISFFLYLTPNDVWKAQIGKNSNGTTIIYSEDDSCLIALGVWASPVSPLIFNIPNNPSYGQIDIYPRVTTAEITDRNALYEAWPVDLETPIAQYESVPAGILGADIQIVSN